MDSRNPIEELAKHLSTLLPNNLSSSVDDVRKDLEGNLRGGLESGLRSMNLVTREEFEIQNAVLLKTREKLEQLEKTVELLEAELSQARQERIRLEESNA